MLVEIYSDIVCPWCYIGERRFARALSVFPEADRVEVVFRPFQLDPSLPETPRPLKEQLRTKFGPRMEAILRNTASTAQQEGINLHFDDALSVNTLTAHRLLWLALQEYGAEVQQALTEKLFEAHFTNGENVADPELLTDLAVFAGMVRDRVEAYLSSEEGLRQVQAEIARAQRLGVQAVPTFVFDGRYAIQGAQSASVFLQVLEEVQREATERTGKDASVDSCADRTCTTGNLPVSGSGR